MHLPGYSPVEQTRIKPPKWLNFNNFNSKISKKVRYQSKVTFKEIISHNLLHKLNSNRDQDLRDQDLKEVPKLMDKCSNPQSLQSQSLLSGNQVAVEILLGVDHFNL
jgi:hypothetical protein